MAYVPNPVLFRAEVRHAVMCSGLSRKKIAEKAQVGEESVRGLIRGKRTQWWVLMRIARDGLGLEPREVRNGVFALQPEGRS